MPLRGAADEAREDSGSNITCILCWVMLASRFWTICLHRIMAGSVADNVDTCPMLLDEATDSWPAKCLRRLKLECWLSGYFML